MNLRIDWEPEGDEPYAEIWMLGPDESSVIWPPERAGEPRPGARDIRQLAIARQRTLSGPRITAYARLYEEGVRPLTWDAIGFVRGFLAGNGHHRCEAVILSGVSVPVLAVFNLPPEAFDIGDQGQKRTNRQLMHQHGVEHPEVVSPAATMLFRWQYYGTPGHRTGAVFPHDEQRILEQHPRLANHATLGRQLAGNKRQPGGWLRSHGLATMLAYLINETNPESGSVFLHNWATDIIHGGTDPIHHLRQWLMAQTLASHGTKGGIDVTEKGAQVILHYNAWVRSESLAEAIEWRRRNRAGRTIGKLPPFPKLAMPEDAPTVPEHLTQFVED